MVVMYFICFYLYTMELPLNMAVGKYENKKIRYKGVGGLRGGGISV